MPNSLLLIDIDGIKVPIKVIEELRTSARASLGKDHVILRIPKKFVFRNVDEHLKWAKNWLIQLRASKPKVLDRYKPKTTYEHGNEFSIGDTTFVLQIIRSESEIAKIKLQNTRQLLITIPQKSGFDQQKLIRQLLIKFCQRYFLPAITLKVKKYNDLYFNKPINSIRLKYNKSNWGSCSTGNNLNFSVRLFFAPEHVIDYVVVHELAHLLEMNHSERFWKIVEGIIPKYKLCEKTLKDNSSQFDF
jgi:predicted metal-dependent hydrolase